ncbi:MAG: hypothetical protein DME92_03920, partial [Verrucomicrobia bacterium]
AMRRHIALQKHFVRNKPKTSVRYAPALGVRTRPRVAFCLRLVLNGKEIKQALTPQLMVW